MKVIWNFFYRFIDGRRLDKAIREADMAHKKYHERYYVMSDEDLNVFWLNKQMFRELRASGYIHPSMFIRDLQERSWYFTANGNGTGSMSVKDRRVRRAAYFSFCQECRESMRYIKKMKIWKK